MTIADLQDMATAATPDRPMILTGERSLSYAEAQSQSRQIASGLIAAGAREGDHIALVMANYPEFVLAKLATARAGCTCVPVNFLLSGDALGYVIDQSDSRFLITMDCFRGQDYLADLDILASKLPKLAATFVLATGEPCSRTNPTLDDLAALATEESDAELARREARADGSRLSDVLYTSGTTGRPKGVMITHDMVLRAAYSSVYTRAFEDGRRIQYALPMYHVFGYVECWIAAMFVSGTIIPHTLFDPDEMLDWAERLDTNDLVCVPLMTHKLMNRIRERGLAAPALHTVFNSGGVNVPTVWQEIYDTFGAREIHTGYGMSETTASSTCTRVEDGDAALRESNGRMKLAGTAGDPAIGCLVAEYRAVDPETGKILPDGEAGELQVRGPIVTEGYYRKPEETEAAFTQDGWFRSGDVGKLSRAGWLSLTGRIKETYRCGGEMVMPREIEELFDDYPGLALALVVGIPDPKMGDVGCLCVVADGPDKPSDEDLFKLCRERLARFKVPKHVLWFDASEIPLTVTGRPQKFKLAELAANRIRLSEIG
ncbi:MAG: acyl--CoA ligase [Novosphingobium sp.]|nr:acyl--CoA ligase [Novosphingobium sp.]